MARAPRGGDAEPVTGTHEVFRGGLVHVLADKCKSCIFRSVNDGRIMGLHKGRVSGMVLDAREAGSVIPCHNTIYREGVEPAVCRGYFDLPVQPPAIELAQAMGIIAFDPPPED